ncbi:MAG: DUF3592 domain-containing protein [Chloroflexaceae bacterium]|nr:DUF3592 domain-containing protein [Chloroflexaceae bacterium]NJO06491.1 DUF3592 domain-containing protein [Chloroflexaceae bacterium]
MQPETPPTLMHIFVNDFRLNQLMAMAALLTILGLMLAIFTTYRIVGAAAVVLGVAASVGIVLRMNSFQAVLDNAASTTGTITTMGRSWFSRRRRFRYRISYTYTYNGDTYTGRAVVSLMPELMTLQKGDVVRVLVHKDQPARSLVPVLYPG